MFRVAEEMEEPGGEEDKVRGHQLALAVFGTEKDGKKAHLLVEFAGLDRSRGLAGANMTTKGAVHMSSNHLDVDRGVFDVRSIIRMERRLLLEEAVAVTDG